MSGPITPTPGTAAATAADEPSYIDYETFLDPSFRPAAFANTLVLATNNPTDSPLDLSTPLSRVLFDIQEIDSHIDALTTRSAAPLLEHTAAQTAASANILTTLESSLAALNETHAQLAREVGQKHAEADEVRAVAARTWHTLRLARATARALTLARSLEAGLAELSAPSTTSTSNLPTGATSAAPLARKGEERSDSTNHRALVHCSHTLLALRALFAGAGTPGAEGEGLDRVAVVRALREGVIAPAERAVREGAERAVREFALGGGNVTFAQGEEVRARTVSAATALWLLSPASLTGSGVKGGVGVGGAMVGTGAAGDKWAPTLMLQAVEAYLRSALQSSVAGLARALATLPSLERTLAEVSARCQNVVALEAVLEGTKAPQHPQLLKSQQQQQQQTQGKQGQGQGQAAGGGGGGGNMLQPVLAYLETGSLASYFWRSMASNMAPRVQEIIAKGGVSARTLRTNRQSVADAVRECVIRGSQLPGPMAAAAKGPKAGGGETDAKRWEREVAVMLGSIVNNLGR